MSDAMPLPRRDRTISPYDGPHPGVCSVCGACPCSCFVIFAEEWDHTSDYLWPIKCRARGLDPSGLVVLQTIGDLGLRAQLYRHGAIYCEDYSRLNMLLLDASQVRRWLPLILHREPYATPEAHDRLARAWEATS